MATDQWAGAGERAEDKQTTDKQEHKKSEVRQIKLKDKLDNSKWVRRN